MRAPSALEAVLSISELAADLGVSVQAIYDLRSQGRGPRGFRVGRELRFRVSEVEAWLAGLEEADHASGTRAGARHERRPAADLDRHPRRDLRDDPPWPVCGRDPHPRRRRSASQGHRHRPAPSGPPRPGSRSDCSSVPPAG